MVVSSGPSFLFMQHMLAALSTSARFYTGNSVLFVPAAFQARSWVIVLTNWSEATGFVYDIRSQAVTMYDVHEEDLIAA